MKPQKVPVTTGAMAHGSSTSTPRIAAPRNGRFRRSAVARANGTAMAVMPAPRAIVRGMAARKSSSAPILTKLPRPTKGVFSSFASSIRKRLIARKSRIGMMTRTKTRMAPGMNIVPANAPSLIRSRRLVTRPVTEPMEPATVVIGLRRSCLDGEWMGDNLEIGSPGCQSGSHGAARSSGR